MHKNSFTPKYKINHKEKSTSSIIKGTDTASKYGKQDTIKKFNNAYKPTTIQPRERKFECEKTVLKNLINENFYYCAPFLSLILVYTFCILLDVICNECEDIYIVSILCLQEEKKAIKLEKDL